MGNTEIRSEHSRPPIVASVIDLLGRTGIQSLLRTAVLAVLAGCGGGCPGEKPEEDKQPVGVSAEASGFSGAQIQENFDQKGFAGLAESLIQYSVGMDAENKKRFERTLALMATNLAGVTVQRSTFENNPKVRAVTSVSSNFNDTNPPKVTFNENWRVNNGVDIAIAVHELGHVADLFDSKANLDESTWSKVYGAPGKATEIRTELRSWELQLVLLNQMSGGLLDAFYEEVNTKATDDRSADEILLKYAEMVASKLEAREDQKGMLKRWLQIYFNYKSTERFGLNCRWTYSFATQIAAEYHEQGFPIYELDLKPEDVKSDTSRCIDPLPEGTYDYSSYRPYVDLGRGLIGPSPEISKFAK